MRLSGAPSARRLLPVAAVVLGLHLLLLGVRPDRMVQPASTASRSFATRQIESAQPPAPLRQRAGQVSRAPQRAPATAPTPGTPGTPVRPAAPPAATPPLPAPQEATTQPPADSDAAAQPLPPGAPAPLAAVPPHAAAVPQPARLRYEVQAQARGLALRGQAELHWQHDGSSYEARLQMGGPLLPTRVQTSSGRITPQGLEPGRFSDRYRSEQATHFLREQGKLVFSNNRPEAALLAGAQDRLSVVLQLAAMLAGDPAHYPPGSAIAIPTAGTRDSESWVFTVEGEEDLKLPGGALRGLRLQRLPRKEYDYKLELWLAPGMDYAPVRLRLTYPNGDWVDQRWAATDKG